MSFTLFSSHFSFPYSDKDPQNPLYNAFADRSSHTYIRRYSQNPIQDANLTLPWVTYRETIVAPTSITGGGTYINFNGQGGSAYPTKVHTSLRGDLRYFTAGDVIDINVAFSAPVMISSDAYLTLGGFTTLTTTPRRVNYAYSLNTTVAVFLLSIQPNETALAPAVVSYLNTYSLQSLTPATTGASSGGSGGASCGVLDLTTGTCAVQNLPPPAGLALAPVLAGVGGDTILQGTLDLYGDYVAFTNDNTVTTTGPSTTTPSTPSSTLGRGDLLSGAQLHVSAASVFITSFQFLPDALTTWNQSNHHQSNLASDLAPSNVRYGLGSNVKVLVTFSDAVFVLGRPYIDLYLVGSGQGSSNNNITKVATTLVLFTTQIDTHTLLFSTPFSRIAHAGRLGCRAGTSQIRLNGVSQLRRAANFLPLLSSELDLSNVCSLCPGKGIPQS